MHSTTCTDTLILVSADCRAPTGTVPDKPGTVATLQYAMLAAEPYALTSDDLIVAVTAARRGVAAHAAIKAEILATPQARLRASPLVKTWGWCLHHDAEGRVALVARNSPAYDRRVADDAVAKVPGMKSRR